MLEHNRTNISERTDVNKTSLSKNVIFFTIGILKTLVLSMRSIFATVAMI